MPFFGASHPATQPYTLPLSVTTHATCCHPPLVHPQPPQSPKSPPASAATAFSQTPTGTALPSCWVPQPPAAQPQPARAPAQPPPCPTAPALAAAASCE